MKKNSLFGFTSNGARQAARPRSNAPFNTSYLLQALNKKTSYNYRRAVQANKSQPFQEQERRVLKKLRSRLSISDYKNFYQAFYNQTAFKRFLVLKNLEERLGR
jgi:hypothetical protein